MPLQFQETCCQFSYFCICSLTHSINALRRRRRTKIKNFIQKIFHHIVHWLGPWFGLGWLISKHCKNCYHLKSVLCSVQSPINNQLNNSFLILLSSFKPLFILVVLVFTETVKKPKKVIIKDERNGNDVSVLLPINN